MLEVNQLSVQLGGRSVLQEVNLKLDQGQFMGLIGPNGAGKTTLLRAILGLVPSTGTITWQGQRIGVKWAHRQARLAASAPPGAPRSCRLCPRAGKYE